MDEIRPIQIRPARAAKATRLQGGRGYPVEGRWPLISPHRPYPADRKLGKGDLQGCGFDRYFAHVDRLGMNPQAAK